MWIYKVVAFVFLSKSIQDTSASICHEQMHGYNHYHPFYDPQTPIIKKSTLTCFNVSSVLNLHLPPLYEHTVRVYDQELNITRSNVSILPPQAFSRFHQIETLYLSGINLKSIQAKAFENLTKVHNLHLEYNELTELKNDTFLGLDFVEFLDLSGNKIFKMEKGTFLKLNFLKTLHLNYNRISIFDVKFIVPGGVWSSLNYLDLSGNPLQKISQRAQYSLTLSNISLTDSNCLMMDGKIHTMYLTLSMNRLNTFNCSAFRFESRSLLDLSNNLIDSIINCDMDLFYVLNLSHNRMEILNTTFSVTSHLDLSHNRIKILENLFSKNITHIWCLDLSYNEISTFNKNILLGLSNGIDILNMAFNKIQMIPQGFFKKLKIKNLDLSSNKIENFQFGTFEGLTGLEILNVSNNQLVDLDPRLFHSSTSLKRLYFDNNAISHFDVDYVVAQFGELELISFDHNSWNCEDLVHITRLFEKHRTEVIEGESFDVQNHYGIACISRVNANTTDGYSFETLHHYLQNVIDDRVVKSQIYHFLNESFKDTAFFQRFNETKFSKPKTQNYTRPFIIATYVQIIIYCFVLFVAVWFYMFLAKLNVDRSEIVTSRLELVPAD